MSNIFRIDSKIYEFLTLMVNLVLLNLIWLLCCLPVITVGAATVALYYVVMNYVTKQDDAVFRPYIKSFALNFRQATPIWILQLSIGCMLFAELLYLLSEGNDLLMAVLVALIVLFLSTAHCYFGLVARYNTGNKQAIWNAFALSMKYPIQSISIALLNLFPAILCCLFPGLVYYIGLFWLIIGVSLSGLFSSWIMMSVFKQYECASEKGEDIDA